MAFFKTQEPKARLRSIVHQLHTRIQEEAHEKWADYLLCCNEAEHAQIEILHLGPDTDLQTILGASSWSRSKEHFSWSFDQSCSANDKLRGETRCRMAISIFFKSNELIIEIEKTSPDYNNIKKIIGGIKKQQFNWVFDNDDSTPPKWTITIEDFKSYGKNILTIFASSIVGLIGAPAWTIIGLLALPLYYASQTEYLGSPTFLLDCFKYFFNSLIDLLSTVIFPIAIYQSKEQTGSYNVFKGDILRCLNSIESLAQELSKSNATISENVYQPNPADALD